MSGWLENCHWGANVDFYVNSKIIELELLLPSSLHKRGWWHGILGVGEKMLWLQKMPGGPSNRRSCTGNKATEMERDWWLNVPLASSLCDLWIHLTTPYLQRKSKHCCYQKAEKLQQSKLAFFCSGSSPSLKDKGKTECIENNTFSAKTCW